MKLILQTTCDGLELHEELLGIYKRCSRFIKGCYFMTLYPIAEKDVYYSVDITQVECTPIVDEGDIVTYIDIYLWVGYYSTDLTRCMCLENYQYTLNLDKGKSNAGNI